MSLLAAAPPTTVISIEIGGICLLALEVFLGHKVEEITQGFEPWQRLQALYTVGDYRGFWIKRRLQVGDAPDKAREMADM